MRCGVRAPPQEDVTVSCKPEPATNHVGHPSSPKSPLPEYLAAERLHDERAQAVAILLHGLKNVLYHEFVAGFHVAPRGVTEKLLDEMAGESVRTLRGEDAFEIGKVGIGLAGAERPSRIHFRGGLFLPGLGRFIVPGASRGILELGVGLAPTADRVKGFEAEAK